VTANGQQRHGGDEEGEKPDTAGGYPCHELDSRISAQDVNGAVPRTLALTLGREFGQHQPMRASHQNVASV
jgi:hypothetical protein